MCAVGSVDSCSAALLESNLDKFVSGLPCSECSGCVRPSLLILVLRLCLSRILTGSSCVFLFPSVIDVCCRVVDSCSVALLGSSLDRFVVRLPVRSVFDVRGRVVDSCSEVLLESHLDRFVLHLFVRSVLDVCVRVVDPCSAALREPNP
jgi:hypothetical protein